MTGKLVPMARGCWLMLMSMPMSCVDDDVDSDAATPPGWAIELVEVGFKVSSLRCRGGEW